MIVIERDDRLLLIRQLDHAAVAGHAAEAWGNVDFEAPEPLPAVALAAARHDEGWREWDEALRFDAERCRPLNFLDVEIEDYVRLYSKGIARLCGLDAYAGVLVSMHGTGNVCGRWGVQPGIRLTRYDPRTWPPVIERYVLEQESLQARLKLQLLGLDPGRRRSRFERRLWWHYELLQAWDRLSLFLCRTDQAAEAEADLGDVAASSGDAEPVPLRIRTRAGGRARLRPWPFRSREIELDVPVREMPNRRYEDQGETGAEVAKARPLTLRWRLETEDG